MMSRMRTVLMVTAAAVAVLMAVPAGATPVCTYGNCYFYGGDFNPNYANANGLSNEQDGIVNQGAVYTPFVVASPIDVSGLFSMNLMGGMTAQSASWEIRSDVSEGSGGTLIASGSGTPTVTDTGISGLGYENYQVEVSTPNILLGAGTYWFNVTPVCPTCQGRSFNSNTEGSGAIGTAEPSGIAFWNSSFFGANFTNALNEGSPDFSRFSSGVEAAPVPEPGTVTLLGLGLLGMVGAVRRRWLGMSA